MNSIADDGEIAAMLRRIHSRTPRTKSPPPDILKSWRPDLDPAAIDRAWAALIPRP